MPHVASQAKSHAVKYSQPHQSRAPAQDRSPSGAFESMLDDNAAAAIDRAAPRADAAKADRATPAQKTGTPDKTAKTANTQDNAPANADDAQPATVETDAKPIVAAKPDATEAKADGDAQLADALTTQTDADVAAETPAVTQPLAEFAAMVAALETLTPAATDQPETDTPAAAQVEVQTAPVAATMDAAATASAKDAAPVETAAPAQTLDVIAAVQETAAPEEAQPVTADLPKVDAKKDGKDDKNAKTDAALLKSDAKNSDDLQAAGPQTEARPQAETETGPEAKPQHANAGEADKNQAAPAPDKTAPAHHTRAEATPAPQLDATVAAPNTVEHTAQHVLPHALQGLTSSINTAAAAATTQPADQSTYQQAAVPLASVAVEIASQALQGKNRFEIRLDPPELGRIDVRLDVDRDGNVTSRLIVDRQDTLDLLRRDSTGLERALQDAGLKTSDNGLQFSLRDQQASGQDKPTFDNGTFTDDEALPALDAGAQGYSRLTGRVGGLDIRV